MIPSYPKFKKLKFTDKNDINKFTKKYTPSSDYNFAGLWSYNTNENIEISILNGNLVMKSFDYITLEPFYSFIGTTNSIQTAEELIKNAKKNNISPVLKLILDETIKSMPKNNNFIIKEDVDNHDYVLSVKDLSEFKGKKYYDKRNLVNRFKKCYPNHTVKELDLKSANAKKQILNIFYDWEKTRKKQREETKHELIALKRLIDKQSYLNLRSLGIFIDSKLISFTIKELLHDNYSIIHFEKNNIEFDGVSSFLRQESAKYLASLGYEYINFEQDLGIEGLRKAKKLWRPVFFVKKYTISSKN